MRTKALIAGGWGLAGATLATAAAGPVALSGGVGVDEIFGHDQRAVYALELTFAELGGGGWEPVVEATMSEKGAVFVGAGLAWRFEGAAGFGLRVAVAPGFYDQDEGRDLGGHFQIMSFIEGTWRTSEHGRLGLRLAHISNANTHAINPGTEILSLTYSVNWR